MSKLLDLRNKSREKIRVIEHIVFQPRSFKYEMARMFIVIFTVAAIGFGISNADDIPVLKNLVQEHREEVRKSFNTRGIVSEINGSSITIINAKNTDEEVGQTYIVELNKLPVKINGETRENTLIRDKFGTEFAALNIEVGQTVIIKGLLEGDIIFAHTVVIFPEIEKFVFETATTTIDVETTTATTTEDVSENTIDTAPTTESSTSTEDTATTTTEIATSTEDASTTEDTSTTTESENTDQNIVEQVIETVTETVTDVVDAVVEKITDIVDGNTETQPEPETTPEPASEPELVS